MGRREFIKDVPNRLTGLIIGLVIYGNAEYLADAVPSEFGDFVGNNMMLIGQILIGISLLKLAVDWYLVATEDDGEKKI